MERSATGATVWAMPTITAVAAEGTREQPDAVLRHGRVEEEEAAGAMRAALEAVGAEFGGRHDGLSKQKVATGRISLLRAGRRSLR